jgi:hypothetical protein
MNADSGSINYFCYGAFSVLNILLAGDTKVWLAYANGPQTSGPWCRDADSRVAMRFVAVGRRETLSGSSSNDYEVSRIGYFQSAYPATAKSGSGTGLARWVP